MVREDNGGVYEFDRYLLDVSEQRLLREGQRVQLKPKAFELLTILAQNGGHMLTKAELMQRLWPDRFVEEHNLTVGISELRQALGQRPGGPLYIETIPRRGYRFVADVRRVVAEDRSDQETVGAPFDREMRVEESQTSTEQSRPLSFETIPRSDLLEPSEPLNKSRRKPFAVVPILIIALTPVVILVGFLVRKGFLGSTSFQELEVVRITNTGNIIEASISLDGRYIAYIMEDKTKQSLWVKQVHTDSRIEILSPSESQYWGVTFSRDGNHVYYLKLNEDNSYTLCQIPALGGFSREVMTNVDSPVGISPDGKQFAFLRRSQLGTLMVADADGTNQRALAARQAPNFFTNGQPAWSPDGKTIAVATGNVRAGTSQSIVGIRVSDGREETITSQGLSTVMSILWLPDGSGLVVVAADGSKLPSSWSPRQLWHISYPGGQPRRITNDSNEYSHLSVTADSGTLITVQTDMLSNIWIMPMSQFSPAGAHQVSSGRYDGYEGLSLTPDGRIIYSTNVGGEHDIWMIDNDGGNKKQLTNTHLNVFPSACPDGHTVAFTSYQNGTPHIWMMDIDSGRQQQLTDGDSETLPQCSPDGRFIVYMGTDSGVRKIFKVPINGGPASRLSDMRSSMPVISPDGKQLAYYYRDQQVKPQWHLAIVPFEGGLLNKTLKLPATIDPYYLVQPLRWSRDGKALIFINTHVGVSNLYGLFLDKDNTRPMTNFSEQHIFGFEWSRDGKFIAISRGQEISDVVMISNFK